MWFLFALICLMGWGFADLFYKIGTDEDDRDSHLKIGIWVGLVMGVAAFVLLPFSEGGLSVVNAVKYAPASLSYILSMVIGYAGLRYLEVSILSPVQNSSGALSALAMCLFFALKGENLLDNFSLLDLLGTAVIVVGVISLAVVEQKLSGEPVEKKYKVSALALLFPLCYCLFDTVGTAFDGIILDGEYGLGLGEIDVLILYGLTFFVAGVCAFFYLWAKNKKPYNPFSLREIKGKGVAALCEEFGQVFYVFAMAQNPVVAAPMIGSYCIVSVLLSRIFLKEKLKKSQYVCVFLVIAGIVMLGLSEGLGEL